MIDNLRCKAYNRRKPIQEHIVRKTRLAEMIGALFPAIQGATPVIADNGSMPDQISLINALISVNPWPATAYNLDVHTGAFTATQQQIMAAEQTYLALSITGAAAVTLPTVATLLATLTPQQAVVGSTTTLRIINATGFTATVTTNTGWTLNGTMAIATTVWRDFTVQITAVGATPTATIQNVGAGDAT
jgi:hypothetical protein